MKIRVTMKRPDALIEGIDDAVKALDLSGLADDEAEAVRDLRKEKARDLALRWFEHGEYLTVEIDTEAETCVVVPKGH
jgi:hypothetical protein